MKATMSRWARAAGLAAIAACAKPGPALVFEIATERITRWTDSTELFLEHPTLITGEAAKFAVHLTDLTDFTPLASGEVTLRSTWRYPRWSRSRW